jgi:hypothetical protein
MGEQRYRELLEEYRRLDAARDAVDDRLARRAAEVYAQLHAIDPSRTNPYLVKHALWDVGREHMLARAEEYWRYGGHESHRDSFPLEWLWDFPAAELREGVERRREKAAREAAERARKQRLARLELYAELKEEFEAPAGQGTGPAPGTMI